MKIETMTVEVAYATPVTQTVRTVTLSAGETVMVAIEQSGLYTDYPELKTATLVVGVFGQKVALSHLVQAGDRVEIYRPLILDPKEARRLRADKAILVPFEN